MPRSKNPPGQVLRVVLYLAIVGLCGGVGYVLGQTSVEPQERHFTIYAHQYAYDPPIIRVNRGDTVRLRLVSRDVVHGFYLEGYDLNAVITPMRSTVELGDASQADKQEIVFSADREGKFRYRCSQTCGYMHPFMLGELIVEPNRLLSTGIGLAIGVLLGGFLMVFVRRNGYETSI